MLDEPHDSTNETDMNDDNNSVDQSEQDEKQSASELPVDGSGSNNSEIESHESETIAGGVAGLNLSAEDETMDVATILNTDVTETAGKTIELSPEDDDEDEMSAEGLNISQEAETEVVTIIRGENLEVSGDAHDESTEPAISITAVADEEPEGVSAELIEEEEIVIRDFLNEDDGEDDDSLDYLKTPPQDAEPGSSSVDVIEEEEIVIRDYLNEDDGEAEVTPDYMKPATPEWKLVAQQLREEREAKRQEMLEKRREEDQRVIAERRARKDEREEEKEQQEADFRKDWEKRQQEKKQAVEDMMQRIREEREAKEQERANYEGKTERINYPKPEPRTQYPKPSELKRMEREQPGTEVPESKPVASEPAPKQQNTDMESRLSRLSKPDSATDSEKEDDGEKEG